MKIEINDEGSVLELSNDYLDNINFIELEVRTEEYDLMKIEEDEISRAVVSARMQISIEDLYSAIKAFIILKDREEKRDK